MNPQAFVFVFSQVFIQFFIFKKILVIDNTYYLTWYTLFLKLSSRI